MNIGGLAAVDTAYRIRTAPARTFLIRISLLLLSSAPLNQAALRSAESPAHDIRPGPGVTRVKYLSDYIPSLAKSAGDTMVYVLEGKEPGGVAFVAGGTHANEIAGILAAIVLVERASVQRGKLIVIPHANNSAVTWTDPKRPAPPWVSIDMPGGKRQFKYGARLTKPSDQGAPDPSKYIHPSSTEELDGMEARNLDRAYPGRAEGNLTERIAYAIIQLLKTESVDIAFDLHESGPESRLAWMIVANPKNVDVAAMAVVNLDAAGISMKLEPSSETFRGLSHREWGDATRAKAFLFETPNPAMVSESRAIDGVNHPKYPLSGRVGVQLSTLRAIMEACNDEGPADRQVKLLDVPGLPEISRSGLAAFLRQEP